MLIAITRAVSESLDRCELTHLPRERMDVALARTQHAAYEQALRQLGAQVVRAREEPELPDAVFVEDAAVALPDAVIITRPGAPSRRQEVPTIVDILSKYAQLEWIQEPGTLDGGDVLMVGKSIFVGRTLRTNDAGIQQLQKIAGTHGYRVIPVEVRGCLHLKSAVTAVGENLLLINPAWVAPEDFAEFDLVKIAEGEAYAANGLLVGGGQGTLLYPSQFLRTRERLERRVVKILALDNSELAKAEGAMTCCSILLER
jgi:dimethylargininase